LRRDQRHKSLKTIKIRRRTMSENKIRLNMGWIPDYPDFRDFPPGHVDERPGKKKATVPMPRASALPPDVNLRQWCSPVENQESLGSCTANAGVGMLEYFEKRAFGKHLDASRLFLYKVTRNLMQLRGDTGASLRSTMGAMALFGVPPEKYWPYKTSDFEIEPPAFCYSFARNYQSLQYFRLDPTGLTKDEVLNLIKSFLNAGFTAIFGFTVFSSIGQAGQTGKIPFPIQGDNIEGGHAVLAIGYDDNVEITNTGAGSNKTVGAIKIRNSWSDKWGEGGYGWLPYEYILSGLAKDWWSLTKSEWIETGQFDI